MNLRQLEYFVSAAETKNFTRTAERFFISQTAESLQIKLLEEELKAPLFERSSRKIELTPAGRVFLEDARAVLGRLAAAKQRVANIRGSGSLIIGCVKSFSIRNMLHFVQDFQEDNPGIQFDFIRKNVSALYDALDREEIDVAFNFLFGVGIPEEMNCRVIEEVGLVVAMHREHPLAVRSVLVRQDLKNEPVVLFQAYENEQQERQKLAADYKNADFLPEIVQVSDDIDEVLVMTAIKKGIAVLPEYALHRVHDMKNVVLVPLAGEKRKVGLVWKKSNTNEILRRFLSMVTEHRTEQNL